MLSPQLHFSSASKFNPVTLTRKLATTVTASFSKDKLVTMLGKFTATQQTTQNQVQATTNQVSTIVAINTQNTGGIQVFQRSHQKMNVRQTKNEEDVIEMNFVRQRLRKM